MSSIGKIELGSKNGAYKSAVAFFLSTAPKNDYQMKIEFMNIKWHFILNKRNFYAVAKTKHEIMKTELIDHGHSVIQMGLDLFGIENNQFIRLENTSSKFIIVYVEKEQSLVEYYDGDIISPEMNVKVSIMHNSKIIEEKSHENNPNWIEALRYYRLSRISTDIVDAYRNLFMSFESLLYHLSKIEKERKLIAETIKTLDKEIDFTSIIPKGIATADYIVNEHYKKYRNKLFHAKRKIILPFDKINNDQLYEAYIELNKIWQLIASSKLNMKFKGSGFFTQKGFELMTSWFNCLSIFIKDIDGKNIPLNKKIITEKYTTKIYGKITKFKKNLIIKEIQGLLEQDLMISSEIKEGLKLNDSDIFVYNFNLELINKRFGARRFINN